MNCYNGSKYLNNAIDSVLQQSYEKWEIIFWDNVSTDDSAQKVAQYSDNRIRYFYASDHTDLGEARNRAVAEASGEWVAFLDCDDLWMPEKLKKQVDIILQEDDSLSLVYGKTNILIEDAGKESKWGKRMHQMSEAQTDANLPEGRIFEQLLEENFISLVSSMVRRDKYIEVGGINPAYNRAEDYELFVKIAHKYKVRVVQEPICSYRIHGDNMSHIRVADNYYEAIEIISRYLPNPLVDNCIKRYQTLIAVEEIRLMQILKGLKRLFMSGDIGYLLSKLKEVQRRRLMEKS